MSKTHEPAPSVSSNDRRQFLQLAGAGAGALLLAGALPSVAAPTAPVTPPKPGDEADPHQALARLMAGNHRFAANVTQRHDFMTEREILVSHQHPFATVLGCADSRAAPEHIFDTGLGELFTVRVAGNFVTDNELASLEYAVAVLGTPVVMVLGHDSCGALSAAVKAIQENATFPGKIQGLAQAFKPSVNKVLKAPGPLLANAIAQNVIDTVARLKHEPGLLSDAVARGKLGIVGGVYRLHSGVVELIA